MVILERLEDTTAVLETDDGILEVSMADIPRGALEGDVLVKKDGKWEVDTEQTEERRAMMRSKLKKLIGKNNE